MIGDRDLLVIVAALTDRLGGEVHLTWQELTGVDPVNIYRMIDPQGDVLLRMRRPPPPDVIRAEVIQVGPSEITDA